VGVYHSLIGMLSSPQALLLIHKIIKPGWNWGL
jgi:hypothetical protein